MGQLRSAFLAEHASVADAGIDVKSAFHTGRAFLDLPHTCRFIVLGEYQFKAGEEYADHIFDAQVDSPNGHAAAKLKTAPSSVKKDSLLRDSRGNPDNFTATLFAFAVQFEAQEFGRHYVTVTLDGEGLIVLHYDVMEFPGDGAIPSDIGSITSP
jgi:hypothetical protein